MIFSETSLDEFKNTFSAVDWNSYKELRNYMTCAIRREKKAYLDYDLSNKNSKTMWNTLRTRDNNRKKYLDISNH